MPSTEGLKSALKRNPSMDYLIVQWKQFSFQDWVRSQLIVVAFFGCFILKLLSWNITTHCGGLIKRKC